MRKIKDHSLYLVISEEYGKGRDALEIARSAITGGVDIIQLREKDKPENELARLGTKLCKLCKEIGVIFIINDDPVLAKDLDADGVHLGQEDIKSCSIKDARKILGKDRMIGVSTHSLEQFERANSENVDYIAFGPIFTTKTKDYHIGTGEVQKVLSLAQRPVFFIGGITLSNIDEILNKGARNIALIRGILEADNIASRTREFKNRLGKRKKVRGK